MKDIVTAWHMVLRRKMRLCVVKTLKTDIPHHESLLLRLQKPLCQLSLFVVSHGCIQHRIYQDSSVAL